MSRNPGSIPEDSPAALASPGVTTAVGPRARTVPGAGWAVLAWVLAAVALIAAAGWALAFAAGAGVPVTVAVDGYSEGVRTTRGDVAGVLADLGLDLRPADRLSPPADTAITPGLAVVIQRARPALVNADGVLREVHAQAATVADVLAAAGVRLAPEDEVLLDGLPVAHGAPLPPVARDDAPARYARGRAWEGRDPVAVRISVRRAVPISVDDGSVPYTIFTTAETVGEALLREQVTVYLGDRVQPGLGSRVSAGLRVRIERSTSVIVTADGRTTQTRTRGDTVGATLMELGILVAGSDRVTPALHEQITERLEIRVTRIAELTLIERQPIPYESIMVHDDNLELDVQRLAQAGQDGEFRRRWKVVYADGVETSRVLLDEWVAAEPVRRMVAYGRKIVLRTLQTDEGEFTYWRKIRMYANSYSPARAGTPATAAWYGRTRIGLTLVKGIVAVDPRVIPLRSYVYVPSYGKAIAGDTGGGIRGKWIDMGYSDHDYVSWHWWTDVYLLAPAPPASQILWVLPNYPPPGWPRNRNLGPAW